MEANAGCELDKEWLQRVRINAWCAYESVKDVHLSRKRLRGVHEAAWLLRAVSCIDLTTLSGDDTRGNVARMCRKAMKPVSESLLKELNFPARPFTTAAVCVYPARVPDAARELYSSDDRAGVEIASVATGFPSGLYNINSRLAEIRDAVAHGATEIDVVIDRSLALTGKWDVMYKELQQMKSECKNAKMKTILGVGELSTFDNIYKASIVAMMAGSDFIKTSTGKESVNATLPAGLIMMRAIRDYRDRTGHKVGFKAAGGIRTPGDALDWLILVKRELGDDWLNKDLFRIGASALLSELERRLHFLARGEFAPDHAFATG